MSAHNYDNDGSVKSSSSLSKKDDPQLARPDTSTLTSPITSRGIYGPVYGTNGGPGGGSASPADGASPRPCSLDDLVEHCGCGPYQTVLVIFSGVVWAIEAMEVFLLTLITKDLQTDLGATETETSVLLSAAFLGMMIGALVIGVLGDVFGRRVVALGAFGLVSVAGIVSAAAPNMTWLIIIRFFCGIGIGGNFIGVILMEFIPPSSREIAAAVSFSVWTVGALLECLLALMCQSNWRLMMILTAVPFVITTILFNRFVPESPRWLLINGQPNAALDICQKMAKRNDKSIPPGPIEVAETVARGDWKKNMAAMFHPGMRLMTGLSWFIWFAAAAAYYGFVILTTNVFMNGKSVGGIALSSIGEVPTYILMFFMNKSPRIGRRRTLILSSIVGSIWMLLFFWGVPVSDPHLVAGSRTWFFAVLSSFTARCFLLLFFDTAVLMTPEAFPTEVRSTATGTSSTVARISSAIIPILIQVFGRGHITIYLVLAVLMAMAGVAAWAFPFETQNRCLADAVSPRGKEAIPEAIEMAN